MSTNWFAATAKIWNNGLYFRREGQKGIPQEVCCLLILCDIISTFLIVLVLCPCIASINHPLFLFLYVFKKLIVEDFKKHKNKETTTSKGELWIIMSDTMSQIIFWHISALKHERNRSMMESFDVSDHLKQLKIFFFLCVFFIVFFSSLLVSWKMQYCSSSLLFIYL